MRPRLTNAVVVEFSHDPELLAAFLAWQREHDVFPLRCGSMTGNGACTQSFDIKHRPALSRFLRDQQRARRQPEMKGAQ